MPTDPAIRTAIRPAICPLCEATCGILVQTDGSTVSAVRGDPDDPFSRGYICPKATALVDLHADPDRIRTPLVREGGRLREATWDEALERAARGFESVRRAHGRDAVAVYTGNPSVHNLGLMTHGYPFARALRTKNLYSASSLDQLPQMVAAYAMYGHMALLPVPDIGRTDYFLVLGANPVVSNGSLMTAPNMRARLKALRERGAKLVVVDPRRTETAALADEHVFIRPGTDALFLSAMLQVIFDEGLARLGRFEAGVGHLAELRGLVEPYTPERVAARTAVAPETIRRIARELAGARRAACYGRVGVCTQRLGTVASWLVQALNAVTGNLDEIGGMMITTPAVDIVALLAALGMRGSHGRYRSRVRGLPEFSGELPVATLAEEIETPGRGQIRALLTMAGNPVLSSPNGTRLERALESLEHVVAVDGYLNETTRHAHVILPPAPPLSRGHYDLVLNALAVQNVAKYAPPAVPRAPGERLDWEIMAELSVRLFTPPALRRAALAAARLATPERILDGLLRVGPHKMTLARLEAAPHGIDVGPLEPGRLAANLATKDGRIDLAPAELLREASRELPRALDEREGASDLLLIGRRELRSNNSWMHNSHRLVKGPKRCTLLVHPKDAAARGVGNGDLARIASSAGSIVAPVEVSDEMLEGVVSLPHGWGHHRDGARLEVARANAGVSVNDVTSEAWLDTLSGTAAFSGQRVTVERA